MAKLFMQAEKKIIFQSEVGPRALRNTPGAWKILSVLSSTDTKLAQEDLEGGAHGFVLTTLESVAALRGLPLHKISIRNEAGDEAGRSLMQLILLQPIDPERLNVSFGVSDAALAHELAGHGFAGPFARLQNADDDLAQILKSAVAWKNQTRISVRLNAASHMFVTLAKFRALRILWQREFSHIELEMDAVVDVPHNISAEHYMLHSVSACMGAGLGGADSIAIMPFKIDGQFERRLSRNVQNILLKESQVAHVNDVGSGAGYVEQLTRKICDDVWERLS
jgi:methylmalonyl-CoA mutase